MKVETSSLSAQIMRVINQLIFLEKKSVFTHASVTLYPSELHLMEVVIGDDGANVTTMAERLGITKGAVSQTISRLVKKKMVTKTRDPLNKNELTVHFTTMGKKTMDAFSVFRSESRRRYEDYLSTLTNAQRQTIGAFLAQLEQMIADLK